MRSDVTLLDKAERTASETIRYNEFAHDLPIDLPVRRVIWVLYLLAEGNPVDGGEDNSAKKVVAGRG